MIEFNHDYGSDCEPKCGKYWGGGEKFFHGLWLIFVAAK